MKRSYKQNCALAHALDVVGERWTLLIVRELLIGPRRYGELQANLAGIGTNLLAERLKELEARGLIGREGQRYALTAAGRELEPVVFALVRFGLGLALEDEDSRLTRPAWDVVALRALYSEEHDDLPAGRYAIELNAQPFCIDKLGSGIRVRNRPCEAARARVSLDKPTARALGTGSLSFAAA